MLFLGALVLGPGAARAASSDDGTAQAITEIRAVPDTVAPAPDEPRKVDEFLLIASNGERIEGHDGRLTGAHFTGVSLGGKQLDLRPEDIATLYRREGSQAGVMALCGAGVGLALSGIVVLRAGLSAPEPFHDDTSVRISAAAIGGSTLLGALIGLAIGAGRSRWSVEPLVAPGQQYSLLLAHPL